MQGELTYRSSSDGTGGLNTVAAPKGVYGYKALSEKYSRVLSTESNNQNIDNQLVTVDASRFSAVYVGNSLQPSALQALPCIRI